MLGMAQKKLHQDPPQEYFLPDVFEIKFVNWNYHKNTACLTLVTRWSVRLVHDTVSEFCTMQIEGWCRGSGFERKKKHTELVLNQELYKIDHWFLLDDSFPTGNFWQTFCPCIWVPLITDKVLNSYK